MDITDFFFDWMIELNFILIPFQCLFILSEIKIFNFKSPFLLVWSDSVNEDCSFLFSWFINEDSLSVLVLLKVMSLLAITTDLIKLRIYLVHVFD